jgi:hypothetical protein
MGASSALFKTVAPIAAVAVPAAAIAATGGAAAPLAAPSLTALGGGATAAAGGTSLLTTSNIALGASVAGTAMQGYGAYRGASDQASVDRYNADVANADARYAERDTAAKVEMMTREARRTMGRQRALFGISGFTPTGSLAGIAQDSAEAARMDALALRYGGQMEAANLRNRGKAYRARGDRAQTAGVIGAGTSLLAGAAQGADYWSRR